MLVRLCVISALCMACAVAQGAGEQSRATGVLTFIEVRSDVVERGKTLLRQHEGTLRQNGKLLNVETLEKIRRPERFVILESATRTEELASAEASARPGSLDSVLSAPPDRRLNREFGETPGADDAGTARKYGGTGPGLATSSPSVLYVVAHVDIGPPDQARGVAALERLIGAARHAAGNLRFEVWQQLNRPNHFNLVAVWSSRAKLNEFNAGAAAREFRGNIAPVIGSPYDERLYRPMGSK